MNLVSDRRIPSFFVPMLLAVLAAALITGCGTQPIFSYQGRLTTPSGDAVSDGTYDAQYILWTSPTTGQAVYTETEQITVVDGLFNTEIGIDSLPTEIFSQPLWMEVTIEGEKLTPRQALRGAPYAMSLAGGAVIGGNEPYTRTLGTGALEEDKTGATVLAYNASTGSGIIGATYSDYEGFLGLGRTAGVAGISRGAAYGGYFESDEGVGVMAQSNGSQAAGFFIGDIATTGNCTGCALAYNARNGGDSAINPGDLVTAIGVEVDAQLGTPLLVVRRATDPSEAIIGVAKNGVTRSDAHGYASAGAGTAADAGGYLSVVVQGLAQVRVAGPTVIGDRLTSTVDGVVMAPAELPSVARVMSAADENGLVWAMISGR